MLIGFSRHYHIKEQKKEKDQSKSSQIPSIPNCWETQTIFSPKKHPLPVDSFRWAVLSRIADHNAFSSAMLVESRGWKHSWLVSSLV